MNPIRRQGLIVQDVSGENLVYDADSNVAAALNLPATRVFALCDGTRSVDQIVELLGNDEPAMPADAVKLALAELVDADLIDAPPVEAGSTRRQLLIKLGAAAAITLPAVELIAAPTAAAASSPAGTTTTTTSSTTTTTTMAPVPAPVEVPQPVPSPVEVPQPVPSPVEVPQPVPSPLEVPQPVPSPLDQQPQPQPIPSPNNLISD
jgi:hypothetical protein